MTDPAHWLFAALPWARAAVSLFIAQQRWRHATPITGSCVCRFCGRASGEGSHATPIGRRRCIGLCRPAPVDRETSTTASGVKKWLSIAFPFPRSRSRPAHIGSVDGDTTIVKAECKAGGLRTTTIERHGGPILRTRAASLRESLPTECTNAPSRTSPSVAWRKPLAPRSSSIRTRRRFQRRTRRRGRH